jgi:predicted HAD superfamily Cof-like phosphohydrolase
VVYKVDREFKKVREFHSAFNHPISFEPTVLPVDRANKRYAWMLEEINEFLDASRDQDIVEQADAMIDVIYFALGTLVEMGIYPDVLFKIVQDANMSKLFPDGKPHYNEMGKVIKPIGWEDPHPKLKLAIENMSDNSIDISDSGINFQFEEVKKFHQAFNHPISFEPTVLPVDRANKRYAWMLEEINEFLDASRDQDIVEQADAMIDVIYFALGTLVEMGIFPQPLFDIVQDANMSKLFSDGKPHYNEMGKVIKPIGWEDPHFRLKSAIDEMKR